MMRPNLVMNSIIKPDIFGRVPLREFLSQFELIAQANHWSETSKIIALASCLNEKARSISECVHDIPRQFEVCRAER